MLVRDAFLTKKALNFIKILWFFCMYWYDYMIFLESFNKMNYVNPGIYKIYIISISWHRAPKTLGIYSFHVLLRWVMTKGSWATSAEVPAMKKPSIRLKVWDLQTYPLLWRQKKGWCLSRQPMTHGIVRHAGVMKSP